MSLSVEEYCPDKGFGYGIESFISLSPLLSFSPFDILAQMMCLCKSPYPLSFDLDNFTFGQFTLRRFPIFIESVDCNCIENSSPRVASGSMHSLSGKGFSLRYAHRVSAFSRIFGS
jgi:hypothetical protein